MAFGTLKVKVLAVCILYAEKGMCNEIVLILKQISFVLRTTYVCKVLICATVFKEHFVSKGI